MMTLEENKEIIIEVVERWISDPSNRTKEQRKNSLNQLIDGLVNDLSLQNVSEWRYLANEKPQSEGCYNVLCEDGTVLEGIIYCSSGYMNEPVSFEDTESKIIAFR